MLANWKIIFFTILGASGGGTGLCCLFNDTNSLEKIVENLDEKTNIDSLQDQHTKLLIEFENLSNEFKEKIFENDVIHSLLEKHELNAKEEIEARSLKIAKKQIFLELLNACLKHLKEKLGESDEKIAQLEKIEKKLKKEINKNLTTKNTLSTEMRKLEEENLNIQEELKNLKAIKLVEDSNFQKLELQKNYLSQDINSLQEENQADLLTLAEIKKNIQTLKQNQELINKKITEENSTISSLNTQSDKQQETLSSLTANSEAISSSYKQNKKKYEEKTTQVNLLKKNNEKIENQIESLNAEVLRKEEKQTELNKQIEEFKAKNDLKNTLLSQKRSEKSTLEQQTSKLNSLLISQNQENQALAELLKAKNLEIVDLQNQIYINMNNIKSSITAFEASINENQKLKEKMQELQYQKIIYDHQQKGLSEEILNLKINLGYQNTPKKKNTSQELINSEKITKLTSKITNLNSQLSRLQTSYTNLTSNNVLSSSILSTSSPYDTNSKIIKSDKIKIIDWHRKLYDKKSILRKKRIKYAHKLSNLFNFLAQSNKKAFFSFETNLNSIQQTSTFQKVLITDESKNIKLMKFSFGDNNIFICNNNHLLDKSTEETTGELEKKLNWNYPVSIIKDIEYYQDKTKNIDSQTFKYHEFKIIASNDQSTAFGQNLAKNWMKVEVGVLVSENELTAKFDNFFSELKLASEGVRQELDEIASLLSVDLNISNQKINNALKESFAIAKDYYKKLEW